MCLLHTAISHTQCNSWGCIHQVLLLTWTCFCFLTVHQVTVTSQVTLYSLFIHSEQKNEYFFNEYFVLFCTVYHLLEPQKNLNDLCFRVCQCLNRQSNVPLSSHRRSRQMERRRKTNRMLITVTIIFFVSWAPLNMFNILIDTFEPFDNSESSSKMMLMIFAFCHLMAMTSVVTNPVMYGFLNENFKQSLMSLLTGCCYQTQSTARNVSSKSE